MTKYATNATDQGRTMEMEVEPQSYLTNYTKNSTTAASNVLQTMFVSDDEKQVVISPTGSQTEQVVMPVETSEPLNPMYTQPTPRMDDDLDVRPSRGPRDPANITGDIVDNYFKENLTDVLKISRLGSNFSAYLQQNKEGNTMVRPTEQLDMALEWYIPDGTNRQLVNIKDKKCCRLQITRRRDGSYAGNITITGLILQNGQFSHGFGYR